MSSLVKEIKFHVSYWKDGGWFACVAPPGPDYVFKTLSDARQRQREMQKTYRLVRVFKVTTFTEDVSKP